MNGNISLDFGSLHVILVEDPDQPSKHCQEAGLGADPMGELSTSCIRVSSMVKTDKAKLSAQEKAEEIQSSLDPKFPSFVKLMLPSQVSGGFWLGIPAQFCKSNLPKKVVELTLLDEDGKEHTVNYLPNKLGLSGGWRGFAIAHKLVAGDALIFQLVKVTKFKVYIVRACSLAEVDGALGLLKLDAHAKGSDLGKLKKNTKKPARKRVKFHVPVISHGDDKNISPKLSGSDQPPVKVTKTTKQPAQKRVKFCPSVVFHGDDQNISPQLSGSNQPENQGEEVVDSEVLEGIKFSSSVIEFQDIKNLESFNIALNGLIMDSEVSEYVRSKYHALCCSQNSFLHEHLIQGLNCNLVAGMISETVNIADAIKTSNLSTSRDEFAMWQNSLRAFKQLGMNVDFLLSRLEKLVNLAFESEEAVDSRRYREAMIGRTRAEEEMRILEMKLVELKDSSKRFEKEIKTIKLKGNVEKFEMRFHSEVNAPW